MYTLFYTQLTSEQHCLNYLVPLKPRLFKTKQQNKAHKQKTWTVFSEVGVLGVMGWLLVLKYTISYRKLEHHKFWCPQGSGWVLEPIPCEYWGRIHVVKVGWVKSYMLAFYCPGVSTPNPNNVQGSTVQHVRDSGHKDEQTFVSCNYTLLSLAIHSQIHDHIET